MFAYHPEEVLYTGEADPSPYELAMEQRRMERKMKQQVKKYGEEAMRSELKQEFDAAVPTEGFQRSVVLKGEGGSNRSKAKEKDPLKSLLKAMGVKKSAGTKKVEAIAKTDGSPGGPKFDPNNGRPKRRGQARESPEEFALYAR